MVFAGSFVSIIGTIINISAVIPISTKVRNSPFNMYVKIPLTQNMVMIIGNTYLITYFQVVPNLMVEVLLIVSIRLSKL